MRELLQPTESMLRIAKHILVNDNGAARSVQHHWLPRDTPFVLERRLYDADGFVADAVRSNGGTRFPWTSGPVYCCWKKEKCS